MNVAGLVDKKRHIHEKKLKRRIYSYKELHLFGKAEEAWTVLNVTNAQKSSFFFFPVL